MSNSRSAAAITLYLLCQIAPAEAQPASNTPVATPLMRSGFANVSTISAENAAGLLGFCLKNNYLAPRSANPVKSKLMSKPSIGQSSGYQLGQSGRIISAHRAPMSFTEIPQELKVDACAAVLKRGTVLAR